MSKNFYDGYIRNNPRRNAKCNPILYRDNYKPYFKNLRSNSNMNLENEKLCEGFSNIEDDKYEYLKNLKCQGGNAIIKNNNTGEEKMYDLSLPNLIKKEIIGDIKEIDEIHNTKIKNSVKYEDMKLKHLSNTMKTLHYNLNPRMLHAHHRNVRLEPFFYK